MIPPADTSPYPWVGADDADYIAYMRDEWGVPVHDDRLLFEMLGLQVFQAGLSWATILHKREAFRQAFAGWDPVAVSRFGKRKVEALMQNKGIVRNRRKIEAVIANARTVLRLQKERGSFAAYLWDFVGGTPVKPKRPYKRWEDLPAQTPLSQALAKEMKKQGFRFIGPTSAYAYMQAVGLVDDRL